MYTTIKKALAKLHVDIEAVFHARFDTWHGGAPVLRLEKAESLPPVATCFIINSVSLLEEALTMFLDIRFPSHPHLRSLRNKIEWLDKKGALSAGQRLMAIADLRNDYAHELGKYGDLTELKTILTDIEKELRHVGIL